MNTPTYDLIVIGGGPGGVAAATSAALRGKKVALVNAKELMGYGLEGAFKSKTMYEIAREFYILRTRWEGVVTGARVDFGAIYQKSEGGASRLRSVRAQQLQEVGVEIHYGWGKFIDPHTLHVDLTAGGELTLTATNFVIATGTSPRHLRGMEPDGKHILTSDEVVNIDRPIESMLILGAGVIGCEFASIFASLGTRVTLIDTQARIFSHDDPDISEMLERSMHMLDIDILRSARAESMELVDGKVHTSLRGGRVIESDMALLAIGRVPNTSGMGLDIAGVELNKWNYIPTTDAMQTNVPHIYSVGDVGLRDTEHDLSLVHIAEAEGRTAIQHMYGESEALSTVHVPFIVFTLPMVAGAGLNETQARELYGDKIRVGKFAHVRNHRAHTQQSLQGFVKLIVGPEGDDRVLGARGVGDGVDSVIGEVSIMIQHGLPYTLLLDSIQAHPSLSESLQGAAFMICGESPKYTSDEEYGIVCQSMPFLQTIVRRR